MSLLVIRTLKTQRTVVGGGGSRIHRQTTLAFSSMIPTTATGLVVDKRLSRASKRNQSAAAATTYRGGGGGSSRSLSTALRAYPQYVVYGEEAVMAMKFLPPTFRYNSRNQVLSVDNTRKGRMLLEFAPRGVDGRGHIWADAIRFGLSAEEVGLVINQLPHYKVDFSRRTARGGDSDQPPYGNVVVSPDLPEKVLTVEPDEHGTVNFTIDYVRDGVGGQDPGHGQEGQAGPYKVGVHAGEYEVVSSIMRYSIPHLTGWSRQAEIAMNNQVNEAINKQSGFSSGSEVPF